MTSRAIVRGSVSPTLASNLGGTFCSVFSVASASWMTVRCRSSSCNGGRLVSTVIWFGLSVDLSCAAAGTASSAKAAVVQQITCLITVLPGSDDNRQNVLEFRRRGFLVIRVLDHATFDRSRRPRSLSSDLQKLFTGRQQQLKIHKIMGLKLCGYCHSQRSEGHDYRC